MTTIALLEDLTPALEEGIASMAVDWADPETGRISWDEFLERVERYLDLDLPTDYRDPVILRIQKVSRQAVREART